MNKSNKITLGFVALLAVVIGGYYFADSEDLQGRFSMTPPISEISALPETQETYSPSSGFELGNPFIEGSIDFTADDYFWVWSPVLSDWELSPGNGRTARIAYYEFWDISDEGFDFSTEDVEYELNIEGNALETYFENLDYDFTGDDGLVSLWVFGEAIIPEEEYASDLETPKEVHISYLKIGDYEWSLDNDERQNRHFEVRDVDEFGIPAGFSLSYESE